MAKWIGFWIYSTGYLGSARDDLVLNNMDREVHSNINMTVVEVQSELKSSGSQTSTSKMVCF